MNWKKARRNLKRCMFLPLSFYNPTYFMIHFFIFPNLKSCCVRSSSNTYCVKCRFDEHKDKIRIVFKGRTPSEKEVKKELSQAFGYVLLCFSYICFNQRSVIPLLVAVISSVHLCHLSSCSLKKLSLPSIDLLSAFLSVGY